MGGRSWRSEFRSPRLLIARRPPSLSGPGNWPAAHPARRERTEPIRLRNSVAAADHRRQVVVNGVIAARQKRSGWNCCRCKRRESLHSWPPRPTIRRRDRPRLRRRARNLLPFTRKQLEIFLGKTPQPSGRHQCRRYEFAVCRPRLAHYCDLLPCHRVRCRKEV